MYQQADLQNLHHRLHQQHPDWDLAFSDGRLTLLMIGLIAANSLWLFLLIFLLPAFALLLLKWMRKKIFQRCWICPACG